MSIVAAGSFFGGLCAIKFLDQNTAAATLMPLVDIDFPSTMVRLLVCSLNLVAAIHALPDVLFKDVVIVGGGASGSYAAVRLREDFGKSITLVEKDEVLVRPHRYHVRGSVGGSFPAGRSRRLVRRHQDGHAVRLWRQGIYPGGQRDGFL